ncbi:hypothetical protein [Microcoleus asticus]|uniref:Uncharacterized protein n=1 Tax=Microcoleus asticus IPMA8 TaxID=2563858 RepID=A0ABX2D1Y8_9CYAN|nr:hypothetical protein [Microcoleus asticus IPMA8]
MTSISDKQTAIIRTERGLTIAGTRITIYDIMDYVTAQIHLSLSEDCLTLQKNKLMQL